jgi:hypothetical protein
LAFKQICTGSCSVDGEHRHVHLVGDFLELVDGRRAVDVRQDQERPTSSLAQLIRQLAGGSGLPDPCRPTSITACGLPGSTLSWREPISSVSLVDDLDHLLAWGEACHHLLAQGAGADSSMNF